MKQFNFLARKPHTVRMSLLHDDYTRETHIACCASLFLLVALLGAVIGEHVRLARAERMHAVSLAALAVSDRQIFDLHASLSLISRAGSIARRVRTIRYSGERQAAEFAEIAKRLPPSLELTSLRVENGCVTLHGNVRSYAVLSLAMRALSQARSVHDARLVQAHQAQRRHSDVEFEFTVAERVP